MSARVRVDELRTEADRVLGELAEAEAVLERRAIARAELPEALAAPEPDAAERPCPVPVPAVVRVPVAGVGGAQLAGGPERGDARAGLPAAGGCPLPGLYDPTGPGKLLFAFFAAMAETERENIRESTLEGLDTAARKGKHGGRPPVITDDMLHTVLRRRANGESVEQIQPDLIIPTGKRKGQNPSVASIGTSTRRVDTVSSCYAASVSVLDRCS
ncbi:recombinase family protein [Streptomyces sp. NPDC004232]|uniref:recombinase family protein n=1 Tax=Streptomyces sp. NPDC004232 TaxID=3154454 RepID=UPI0033BF59AF